MPPELPGFYWDEGRNRYFKIKEDHLATSKSEYSLQKVKKLEEETKKRNVKRDWALKEKKQTVRRSQLLSGSHGTGLKLREESGITDNKGVIRASRTEFWCKNSVFTNLDFISEPAGCFDWDSDSGLFLYATHSTRFPGACEIQETWNINSSDISHGPSVVLPKSLLSSVTGVSCSPSRYSMFAVSMLADLVSRGSIWINPLSEYASPAPEHFDQINDVSAWAVAANPEYPLFACGLTEKFYVIRPSTISSTPDNVTKVKESDVLAVEWLTPSVVACGQRNGRIFLYDIRSGGTSNRLRHPGMAGQLRRADEFRFVASGPEDALCMYDLRMPREDDHGPRSKHKRYKKSERATKPLIRYPYRNRGGNPGLALSHELGLLAAGSDSASIEIWSLYHGQRLHETGPLYDATATRASQLKFSSFNDGTLYATCNDRIFKTVANVEDGEE